jgi:hypothetical protein
MENSGGKRTYEEDGEEWEEETVFAVVDLGPQMTPQLLRQQCYSRQVEDGEPILLDDPRSYQLANLDTERPLLRLGKTLVFEGKVERQIGTDMIFKAQGLAFEQKGKQSTYKVDHMDLVAKTSKRIMFKRINLKSVEGEVSEDDEIPIDLETLNIANIEPVEPPSVPESDPEIPVVKNARGRGKATPSKAVRGKAKGRGRGRPMEAPPPAAESDSSLSSWKSKATDSADDDDDEPLYYSGSSNSNSSNRSRSPDDDDAPAAGGSSQQSISRKRSSGFKSKRSSGKSISGSGNSSGPSDGLAIGLIQPETVEMGDKHLFFFFKTTIHKGYDSGLGNLMEECDQLFVTSGFKQDIWACMKTLPVKAPLVQPARNLPGEPPPLEHDFAPEMSPEDPFAIESTKSESVETGNFRPDELDELHDKLDSEPVLKTVKVEKSKALSPPILWPYRSKSRKLTQPDQSRQSRPPNQPLQKPTEVKNESPLQKRPQRARKKRKVSPISAEESSVEEYAPRKRKQAVKKSSSQKSPRGSQSAASSQPLSGQSISKSQSIPTSQSIQASQPIPISQPIYPQGHPASPTRILVDPNVLTMSYPPEYQQNAPYWPVMQMGNIPPMHMGNVQNMYQWRVAPPPPHFVQPVNWPPHH